MWIETDYGLFNADRADYFGVQAEDNGGVYNLVMGVHIGNTVHYEVLESDIRKARLREDYLKIRQSLSHVVSLRHTEALV